VPRLEVAHGLPVATYDPGGHRLGYQLRADQARLPSADIAVFALAGASWLAAGVAYFGYLHKLRRDIVQLERALGYSSPRHSAFN
jgi:hypothetical protein